MVVKEAEQDKKDDRKKYEEAKGKEAVMTEEELKGKAKKPRKLRLNPPMSLTPPASQLMGPLRLFPF